ncbi:MAG: glycoside hydrolase family 71/99-like protein, partial [Ginsengibacter sp.]
MTPNLKLSSGNELKKLSTLLIVFSFSFFLSNQTFAQAPVDPSSIIGKVVCGYQGWFSATGDGAPINRWTHWASGNIPKAGVTPNPNPNLTFEAYPDVSIYDSSSLFSTNFANQGNGNPAKLFSSYKQDVTDKHFALMQANGIDGVAFQRFIWEVLVDPLFKANRDSMALHVRQSAETYQRMFYLVYDLSGLGNVPAASDQVRFDSIKGDWQNNIIANLNLTSSPMYAMQNGKPVVQIWGIGYNHVIGSAAIQLDLINWFKAQGVYVIIGVPTGWRTGTGASNPGWINTYKAGNMISPWSVGAYTDQTSTDNFKNNFLSPDLSYCNSNGLAYQPVIFPGFAWSNWNGGTQNQISRNKGNFLWRQAYNLRLLNIKTAEIAMMDEFDEGTAILPMADGYDMIPTDQYFLTTSADGAYLSSDFYLRLASKATRQINQLDGVNATMPVASSVGPIFFRTSSEPKYDAQPTWSNTTDVKKNVTKYGSNYSNPTCATINAGPHRGSYSVKIAGRDRSSSSSYAYFKVWDVNIPISSNTELSFWNFPINALGRYASIDLVMTDGTTLRDCGAKDANGISMHPGAGRGTVNTWTKSVCNIGTWLNGKTIDKILVAYDQAAQTG